MGGVYISVPPDVKPTYMMQWNLSYQRQVAKDWLVTVNYLGNRSNHILAGRDINPSIYIPGSTASASMSSRCRASCHARSLERSRG